MKNIVFKLRENVDVYKIGENILYFYFINKREGINISSNTYISEFISNLNGERTVDEILCEMQMDYNKDLEKLLDFFIKNKIIYQVNDKFQKTLQDEEFFLRQLVFFQEYFEKDAYEFQKQLFEEKFLFFGIGSIGSGIAIELAMMGIKNFIFIDKGVIKQNSIERHYYFKEKNIGKTKVEALKEYILDISPEANIEIFQETINYDTNLDKYFDLKPSFVINTLDEPYIGLTSLKIGRRTYIEKLPLFVGGGFDGHLMSTGELIIPDKTPCVDCYIDYFTESLKDWKPKYNKKAIKNEKFNIFEVGGLSSMALFSVSYGVIEILKYLANNEYIGKGRGELLFENLEINYINVKKNKHCKICGDKR